MAIKIALPQKPAVGLELRDKVTGFKGIATSKIEYLNGCVQFCVAPKVGKDNTPKDGQFFDIQQLEVIGGGVKLAPKQTGGPTPKGTPMRYKG